MTQTWLIFAEDAKQSYINWHMARNPDANGYFTGVPPFLQEQAVEEGWVLTPPHVWVETLPDPVV